MKRLENGLWDVPIEKIPTLLSDRKPIWHAVMTYRGKQEPRFDMHYGLELGVVLCGQMRRYTLNWQGDYRAGEAWLCGMWEPHGYELLKTPCRVMVMMIWPPALATMRFPEAPDFDWLSPFTTAPKDRPKIGDGARTDLLKRVKEFVHNAEKPGGLSPLYLRMVVMEILLTLCKGWKTSAKPDIFSVDSFSRINRAVRLVFTHRRIITSQEAAKACGLSRNAFGRLFVGMMGTAFPYFSLRYRLHGVAQQLLQTDTPIKAVAKEWGFTDSSHLHRCFGEHYGCTPAQYRKRFLPPKESYSKSLPCL